jgi:NAD(P)-dependent dehydrogenase (short-subunit alcohol dehydrogenase family)
MPNILIIGATRGLGYELAKQYAQLNYSVTGTARSSPPKDAPASIQWITGIDVSEEAAGRKLAEGLKGQKQDGVIITAGYFGKESFDEPDYNAEVRMYKTSAIAPVFIVHHLHKSGLIHTASGKGSTGSKIIIVSSEAGSITLRHESEGGGMYAHHASKAASNMVGKLLSLDLENDGVAVGIVHPGFMRTEMTRSVGFDKFWDDGGAVTPDVAAKSLVEWIENEFHMSKTGEFWAPRGPGDIGTAEPVLGPKSELSTPLRLPW